MRRPALLVAVLLLGGCTAAPASSLPPVAFGSSSADADPGVLAFTGRTLDGRAFDAASMAGKPALLWFWAPWCATCAAQAASVTGVHEEYGDRLGVLGIAGMGGNAEMHEFVSDLEVGAVPHLDDEAGELWRTFKITEQSTYVLVGSDGRVRTTGYLDDLQLTSEIRALVG